MSSIIDMTGWVMKEHGVPESRWTVIERAENDKYNKAQWLCQCSCGTKKIINSCSLRKGASLSCGCINKEKHVSQITNELGHKYGKLTVIDKADSKNGFAMWLVQCDCGSEPFITAGTSLRRGAVKSCGCLKAKDHTNEKYGKLTFIRLSPDKRSKYGAIWECKCDCGRIIEANANDVIRGKISSCGCLLSKSEQVIKDILNAYNITFKTQYCFDDLYTPRGGQPKFDFAIFQDGVLKCLIEYQGIQHYQNTKYFGKYEREVTDQLKKDYCDSHNIPLYEVKYDEDINMSIERILGLV